MRFQSGDMLVQLAISPADALWAAVRDVLRRLLIRRMKRVEVAAALNVSPAQAKAWLRRLVDEGVLEKRNRPDRYIAKEFCLFD